MQLADGYGRGCGVEAIEKARKREDKVLKKPELVKLSVENFR